MTIPDLIPLSRAKELLGIRRQYAIRLIAAGKLKAETAAGEVCVTRESALAFLDSLRPSR